MNEDINFEDAMKRLEEIANELEKGDLTLDESVKKFEDGISLSKKCNEIIENGVNGSIIESHSESQLFDAMKYYCDNPDVVKRMGQVAREIIASKFAKKEFLKLLVDEYNSLS